MTASNKSGVITLAGGCFWCTEAVFSRLKGVIKVTPGYSGGSIENPNYKQVAAGVTGHAESVQIEFDPQIIKLKDLFNVFFKLHDPTTLNRQGADVGTQYRSAIFYNSKEQLKEATKARSKIPNAVTEISQFKKFYPADPSHKEYYLRHRLSPYCLLVIDPKIEKLKRDYQDLVR